MAEPLNFKNKTSWHFAAWAALLVSIMANLPIIDMVFHEVQEVEIIPHVPGHQMPEFAIPGLVLQLIITFLFGFSLIRHLQNHQWKLLINKDFQWMLLLKVFGQFTVYFILMSGLILFTIQEISWIFSSVATRGLLVLVSTGQPLKIEIVLGKESKSLTISNNLQPKVDALGAGIRLKNLDEQFRMLAGRSPEIFSKDGKFTVAIPLIPA